MNHEQKTLLLKKAKKRLITFRGLKVAVLGLTFRAETYDLIEAPLSEKIPFLIE